MERLPIKRIFLDYISPFFKKKGYVLISGHVPMFVLKTDTYYVTCGFNFFSNRDDIYGGKLNLSLWDVENLILEIQYPMQDFTNYLPKNKIFFSTVGDLYGLFNPKDIELNTEERIIDYADEIKRYIEADGQKFIDTYRYLPNVLIEMDKLETQGKSWKEVLCGGPEFLFRGLIISKLCNDPNYSLKKNFVDSRYEANPNLGKWQPYYEKLKARLETLEPLYSMDSDGIYQPIPQPNLPKSISSNLEIDNKTDMINSDLIPETVIKIERFDAVHLEKLNNFLSNIHKHTTEASQARDDDMLNREELLYFQEIHRDQINKAIGDTPIHKAMKLERIEIFPNNTNEFAIYYYALDLGTFTTLAVNVTLSPEGWVEDSRMIVD